MWVTVMAWAAGASARSDLLSFFAVEAEDALVGAQKPAAPRAGARCFQSMGELTAGAAPIPAVDAAVVVQAVWANHSRTITTWRRSFLVHGRQNSLAEGWSAMK